MKRPRRGVSDEGRRLMANVPLPERVLALPLARCVSANYRRKIYGAIDQGKGPFSGVATTRERTP